MSNGGGPVRTWTISAALIGTQSVFFPYFFDPECHINRSDYFDRTAIDDGWLMFPLLDGCGAAGVGV
jgi:hypothetical protein